MRKVIMFVMYIIEVKVKKKKAFNFWDWPQILVNILKQAAAVKPLKLVNVQITVDSWWAVDF